MAFDRRLGSHGPKPERAGWARFRRMLGRMSRSLEFARTFLGQTVAVTIDRPLGSRHPRHGFRYPVNYGFVPGTRAPDGAELDAYVLGVSEPLTAFSGLAAAIVHRDDDDDDKLVVLPTGLSLTDAEISDAVRFQERWFKSSVVR